MTKGILVLGLLAAMVFALAATPAEAGHTSAFGQITVFRGDVQVRQYFRITACNATSCHVDVTGVSKSDLRRIVRACGSDQVTITVPAGWIADGAFCNGSAGAWTVHIAAGLIDATGTDFATHDQDVAVEVRAQR